mmetsp:Transcript_12510/g.18722  ORF Transcript_12510/g.18722 Transcript_12510/m.18722 type:complete len:83 (-) Transcript_12510:104-352(-)
MLLEDFVYFCDGGVRVLAIGPVEEIGFATEEGEDCVEERIDSSCCLSDVEVEAVKSIIVGEVHYYSNISEVDLECSMFNVQY